MVFIVTYPACFANTEKNIEEKRIITLDNALFLQMKNDVAFLINTNEMCLIEHSSTVCLNYPLRSLLYLAREYEVILEQRNEPCLELFVKVLNINDGMNENVLNGCKTLKDYVILISKIRENYNEIGDLAKAIHKAVDYCIDADHLRSFLIRNRAEVEPMLLSEGTVEEYVDSMNEVKEQEIERLKRELSRVTQEKNEALSKRDSEIARLKALFASKENN